MMSRMGRATFLAVMALVGCRVQLDAQALDTSCTYSRCALGIMPRLAALDVVRGDREERVGSLAFVFPHDVRAAFAGNEGATRRAAHALAIRRVGAILTTAGAALVVAGGVRAAAVPHGRGPSIAVAAVGVLGFGASVPVHFAADAELSRAVWEYNRELASKRE